MFTNFMNEAIKEARKAYDKGEVPVGALIVRDGEVIAKDHNRMKELNDQLAHAEMLVLRKATKFLKVGHLTECDLYVSLEPCNMCSGAISLARIKRLYYGASDNKFGGIEFYESNKCHHKPEIYSGFCEKSSSSLMKDFFKNKR